MYEKGSTMATLSITTLRVSDFEKSLDFYERIMGLEVGACYPGAQGQQIAMLGEADHAHLELIETTDPFDAGTGFYLCFELDGENASAQVEAIRSDVDKLVGPIRLREGLAMYILHDPEGYEVHLLDRS